MRKKRKRQREREGLGRKMKVITHSMTREPQMKQNLIRLEDELSKHLLPETPRDNSGQNC